MTPPKRKARAQGEDMSNLDDFDVTIQLKWFDGGTHCTGTLTMLVTAMSEGHAVARAIRQLAAVGRFDVEDCKASKRT